MIGWKLDAGKRYIVDPQRLPTEFQDRLKKDGFDVTRSVAFLAALAQSGFAIEVQQEYKNYRPADADAGEQSRFRG